MIHFGDIMKYFDCVKGQGVSCYPTIKHLSLKTMYSSSGCNQGFMGRSEDLICNIMGVLVVWE